MKKFLLSIAMTSLVAIPSFAQDCPTQGAKGVCPAVKVASTQDGKAKTVAAKSECCADKAKAQAVAKKTTDGCPAAGGECPASAKTVAKPAAGKAECSSAKEKCTVNG